MTEPPTTPARKKRRAFHISLTDTAQLILRGIELQQGLNASGVIELLLRQHAARERDQHFPGRSCTVCGELPCSCPILRRETVKP